MAVSAVLGLCKSLYILPVPRLLCQFPDCSVAQSASALLSLTYPQLSCHHFQTSFFPPAMLLSFQPSEIKVFLKNEQGQKVKVLHLCSPFDSRSLFLLKSCLWLLGRYKTLGSIPSMTNDKVRAFVAHPIWTARSISRPNEFLLCFSLSYNSGI